MQLWDILRSVDYLVDGEKLKLSSISVYGRGYMGALGLYAAALDKRITRVILEDPPVLALARAGAAQYSQTDGSARSRGPGRATPNRFSRVVT